MKDIPASFENPAAEAFASPHSPWADRWALLLVFYAVLHSGLYALTTPVFESPDEPAHLAFVNYVARHRSLPNEYRMDERLEAGTEGHQAPLYYLFAGALVRLSGTGAVEPSVPVNPDSEAGWNPKFLHYGDPFRSGREKAVFYALRLCGSVLMGLTVVQISRAAKVLYGDGLVRQLAPLFAATLPQFAFICGTVSNDALTVFLAGSAILACLRASRKPGSLRYWAAAGIWLGLTMLSKKSGLTLVPALMFLLIPVAGNFRARAKGVVLAACLAMLLLAPVLARNFMLYHELLATTMEQEVLSPLIERHSLASHYILRHLVPGLLRTFLGQFGWLQVRVPAAIILPYALLAYAPLLAGPLAWRRLKDQRSLVFLIVCVVLNIGGIVLYNLTYRQPQGRWLFPCLAPLSLLWAAGIAWLLKPLLKPMWTMLVLWSVLALIDAASLGISIKFYSQ